MPYFEYKVFEDLVQIVDFIYKNLTNHHEDIVHEEWRELCVKIPVDFYLIKAKEMIATDGEWADSPLQK